MKINLITVFFSILLFTGYSQELSFDVHGRYTRPVKKEKLKEAIYIKDFIAGFPVNWITEYVTVQVQATCGGKVMKAVSKTDALTTEQKKMLNDADVSTDVEVHVEYVYRNVESGKNEIRKINASVTVVPETEAEYPGGLQQLKKYLKENAINKIPGDDFQNFQQAVVLFTINDQGEVSDVKISKTSGNTNTDRVLLNAINQMKPWQPARNSDGTRVREEFEFRVGNGGC